MPAQRIPGMDHPHHPFSALPTRTPLTWPGGARIAVGVLVELTSDDTDPLPGVRPAPLLGGIGGREVNVPRLSHREYGHRVGIFRVLEALKKFDVPVSVSLDTETATRYPTLMAALAEHDPEYLGAGRSARDMLSSDMDEATERSVITTNLDAIEAATGVRPTGWAGVEYGESARTPELLAEAGIRYVCDWVNDEQPYAMTTSAGPLCSLPVTYELDDQNAYLQRQVTIGQYSEMLREAFSVLYAEGAEHGRLYLLRIRPWITGQPFRIGVLEQALSFIAGHDNVFFATPGRMVEAFAESTATVSL